MQEVNYTAVTAIIIQDFENPELARRANELDSRTSDPAIETIFANARGNATDWVGLAPKGAPSDTFDAWQYIEGEESGYLVFPDGLAEPGEYEVRLFWEDGYTMGAQDSPPEVLC